VNVATILTLGLIAVCFLRRDNALLYLAFVLLAFGSFSIVPGGTTVLAASAAFLLLTVKVFTRPGAVNEAMRATRLSVMGLLVAFMALAVVWAMIVPRVSGSNIFVYPMAVGVTSFPTRLQPTSANLNQSVYQVISCAVALGFYILARAPRFPEIFLRAVLWGAAAVIVTGLADMIGPHIGLAKVLDLFRTASYTFLNGVEVLGVTRVVGLMPEASSFGALAVSFGAIVLFCRNAYEASLKPWALGLGIGCLAFAALSTSSAGMLALAVTLALLCADLGSRLIVERSADKRQAFNEAMVLATLPGSTWRSLRRSATSLSVSSIPPSSRRASRRPTSNARRGVARRGTPSWPLGASGLGSVRCVPRTSSSISWPARVCSASACSRCSCCASGSPGYTARNASHRSWSAAPSWRSSSFSPACSSSAPCRTTGS